VTASIATPRLWTEVLLSLDPYRIAARKPIANGISGKYSPNRFMQDGRTQSCRSHGISTLSATAMAALPSLDSGNHTRSFGPGFVRLIGTPWDESSATNRKPFKNWHYKQHGEPERQLRMAQTFDTKHDTHPEKGQ
jgi:hypothetical protein